MAYALLENKIGYGSFCHVETGSCASNKIFDELYFCDGFSFATMNGFHIYCLSVDKADLDRLQSIA